MTFRAECGFRLNFYEVNATARIFTGIKFCKGGHHKNGNNGQNDAYDEDYPLVGFHFDKFGIPKLVALF